MARLVGRFANEPLKDLMASDPGPEDTTPGFKMTRRGPGIERVESGSARVIEHIDTRDISAGHAKEQATRKEVAHAAMKQAVAERVSARAAAAAAARKVVEVKPLSPEREAAVHAERAQLRIREALRSQDPRASKTVNSGLHVVATPGGVAKYHKDRQGTALEIARGLKGKDRAFALQLAKEHGSAKRAASGQPRVPAGQPDGGQWTR